MLNPFYFFQAFAIVIWILQSYIFFAVIILIITVGSALVTIIETRSNMVTLANMARSSCDITRLVLDDSLQNWREDVVNSKELVPGDLILVNSQLTMPCDAILLKGQCIVNECMLTGESIPVVKNALPANDADSVYNADKHKAYTLFSGTTVMQTRTMGANQVVAVVTQTGFATAKGKCMFFKKKTVMNFFTKVNSNLIHLVSKTNQLGFLL